MSALRARVTSRNWATGKVLVNLNAEFFPAYRLANKATSTELFTLHLFGCLACSGNDRAEGGVLVPL